MNWLNLWGAPVVRVRDCLFLLISLVILSFSLSVWGQPDGASEVVPRTGWVTDRAGALSAKDREQLEQELSAFNKKTSREVAVLVLDTLSGSTIEDVSYKTAKAWGLGSASKDDGVLLTIAIKERKSRIETGKGIGHVLTDIECNEILTTKLAPALKEGRVFEGLRDAVHAIEAKLESEKGANASATARMPMWQKILIGIYGFFFVLQVSRAYYARKQLQELQGLAERMRRAWDNARRYGKHGADFFRGDRLVQETAERAARCEKLWVPGLLTIPIPLLQFAFLNNSDWDDSGISRWKMLVDEIEKHTNYDVYRDKEKTPEPKRDQVSTSSQPSTTSSSSASYASSSSYESSSSGSSSYDSSSSSTSDSSSSYDSGSSGGYDGGSSGGSDTGSSGGGDFGGGGSSSDW